MKKYNQQELSTSGNQSQQEKIEIKEAGEKLMNCWRKNVCCEEITKEKNHKKNVNLWREHNESEVDEREERRKKVEK